MSVAFLWLLLVAGLASPLAAQQQDTYRNAYDAGYADGVQAGRNDRNLHRPFDFANQRSYQEASTGFDQETQDRDVFVVAYRRGFEDGYEEGYGLNSQEAEEVVSSILAADQPGPVPQAQSVATAGRVVLGKGTELVIRLSETLATHRNQEGDRFRAEVIRALIVDGVEVVPAGSRLIGEIIHLKRPGRIRGRAEMNVVFRRLELPDRSAVPIEATVKAIEPRRSEDVDEEEGTIEAAGEKGEDARQVGTSAGIGALIGIMAGGGAKVGAAVGAVGGLAGVLATRGSDLVLPTETELVIQLREDVAVPTGLLRTGSGP